ncbi:MAG: pyridoxamine 5-phosphate oxidase-related, FMN-binding [Marmoricola sp.]|nr:pyridoxamine 5-phosphate oxidase-related, FMN-binding [Marmoricola sp.]
MALIAPARHNGVMDLDQAADFVRTHHRAVIATRGGGRIHQSPVLVGVDEEGRLVVSSRETAYKTKQTARRPVGAGVRVPRRVLR